MKSAEELLEVKAEIQLHESEAFCLKKELKEECWHPEDFVQSVEKYHEGGYDYRACTEYWQECTICSATFNKHTKEHSWYG